MSAFDVSTFLDLTTEQSLVKRPPLPVGDYVAVIGELNPPRQGVSSKDPTKTYIALDVPLTIDIPYETQQALGLDLPTITVKDSIMLEVSASGGLDMAPGKNGKLRKYRDATGNNVAGKPFNIRMLQGQTVKVKIGHREYPEGSGDLFENVEGVTKV